MRLDSNLILELAMKDIKLRYNNTLFGYLWMVINPILMLITLYIVFTLIMKMALPYYQIFLLLGIIVWNFFSEATSGSITSLLGSLELMKKVRIKPYIIILASNLSSLITFFANLIVLLAIMLFFRIDIFTPIRALGIFYFLILFLLIVSVSFILCIAYLFFKDIVHIWNLILFVGFWLTPIIYPETLIPAPLLKYYMLNPLARIISHLRNTVIYNYVDSGMQIFITVLIIGGLVICSLLLYLRYSKKVKELS